MRKTPFLVPTLLAIAISGSPEFVAAMGSNNPTPPQSNQPSGTTTTKHKTKKNKSSSAKDFLGRYHAAYTLIYDRGDYQAGITALRARVMTITRMWQPCSAMPAASSVATTMPNTGTTKRLLPIPITL